MKKLAALLLLIIPLTGNAALIDDLISYWELNETSGSRIDIHGINDLTDNNTVLYGTGILNNAADFELANSEYLSITDASQTGLDITGDISISAWVNIESAPSNNGMSIAYKWGAGNQGAYGLVYEDVGGTKQLLLNLYDSGAPGSNIEYRQNTDLGTATWHHVVVKWIASTGVATFYVDGTSIGTDTDTSANDIQNGTGVFAIGDLATGVQWFFDGLIDEVGIWDRAISGAEVTELYNSGTALEYPFTEDPVLGCTDPEANNYDPLATEDDASCTYDEVATTTTEILYKDWIFVNSIQIFLLSFIAIGLLFSPLKQRIKKW